MLFRKLFSFVITALFLSITVPVSAHDLPLGDSRWVFGSNAIVGCIDFKPSLFSELKGIKEGHYDVYSISAEQLQQIATDIMQPYVNKRLSITVNDKTYPVKVTKLSKNPINLYTLWLSVDNVSFNKPVNQVKIGYSVLFEETGNEHMNLAFGYLSDLTGDALQRLFDLARPDFQTTFDASNPVWELSIQGPATVAAAEDKTGSPVVGEGLSAIKKPATQKATQESTATKPQPSVLRAKNTPNKQHAENRSVVSPMPSVSESAPDSKANRPLPQNATKASAWATIRQFVPLGIEHILTGYDHIAFLLAIIVIGLSIKEVLKIITAFTIAHSMTLLLAALEVIKLNARFVESVIAFSICYVAVENMFKRKANYRWLIAFGFGLIHGFGFASALQELIVRKANLLLSVVSFNAGVEMGQLMVFFVMLPVLYLLNKLIAFRIVTVSASVGIFAIGFTWLVERLFNLRLLWF
jgi:hydrogenase/urease accessory protein HupE